jgi:hypothetical protein
LQSSKRHLLASQGWHDSTIYTGCAHTLRSVVAELTKRFERAQETGNDEFIPATLASVIYTTVCLHHSDVGTWLSDGLGGSIWRA